MNKVMVVAIVFILSVTGVFASDTEMDFLTSEYRNIYEARITARQSANRRLRPVITVESCRESVPQLLFSNKPDKCEAAPFTRYHYVECIQEISTKLNVAAAYKACGKLVTYMEGVVSYSMQFYEEPILPWLDQQRNGDSELMLFEQCYPSSMGRMKKLKKCMRQRGSVMF